MNDTLYNKALLRLAADAVGSGRLARPDASGTAHNPACGDRVTMDLDMEAGRITALGHDTQACILTQASAAILGTAAIGASRAELEALAEGVRGMLKGGPAPLAAYDAFAGVGEHAARHVCVMLPLQALLEALPASDAGKPGA